MSVLRTLLASLLIVVAGAATLDAATDDFQAFTSETARRISVREHPRLLPAVGLQTADGETVHLASLRGRWVLVEFIYTHCVTYCSAQGYGFATLQKRLAKPITDHQVVLLSISFDPTRDNPAQLAAYQKRSGDSGPGWIAARPTSTQGLAKLLQAFSVTVISGPLGGYLHNSAINVVNPDGQLVAVLDWNALTQAQQFVMTRIKP